MVTAAMKFKDAYSLASEEKMLKLKLQYFGHLMRRVDSLEKTLMLGSTLCDPMDYIACQAPLSMGILQERILEWVAMPSSRGSS